jgi:hypothetical protein
VFDLISPPQLADGIAAADEEVMDKAMKRAAVQNLDIQGSGKAKRKIPLHLDTRYFIALTVYYLLNVQRKVLLKLDQYRFFYG